MERRLLSGEKETSIESTPRTANDPSRTCRNWLLNQSEVLVQIRMTALPVFHISCFSPQDRKATDAYSGVPEIVNVPAPASRNAIVPTSMLWDWYPWPTGIPPRMGILKCCK